MSVLARTESLRRLHLAAEVGSSLLELEPTLVFSELEQLQISSSALMTAGSCRVLCSPALKSITLRRWSQELVDSIAAQCPLLEELVMAGCGETLESTPDLSAVIQRCRRLRSLVFSAPTFDGKFLDDLVVHNAQLSALTIGTAFTAHKNISDLGMIKFVQCLPLHFSRLVLNVNVELAEVILREFRQRPELDLRWISLGSHMDVKICTQRWKDKLGAVFPNLTLM
jgi:hypothetical protein